jgi:two-component system OmpR family sensor kinase
MSLKLRLTFLYSSLVAGILLIFGASVYFLVSILLYNDIDNHLADIVNEIKDVSKVNVIGDNRVLSLPVLDQVSVFYIQVWTRDGKLLSSSSNIALPPGQALDPENLNTNQAVYRETRVDGFHLRVISVPVTLDNRLVGTLQAASNLEIIDTVQKEMLNTMLSTAVVATLLAALGSWISIGGSLARLDSISAIAEQINRADDLAQRIPYNGPEDDEIGNLIGAFNQTLERLENLFTSQQRFLADVSHELRTPLTVIKGNVDLMRRMKKLDEESMLSIDQEAGRLNRLVGGLLLLAQAESGTLPLTLSPLELDTLLLEVFQEMNVLAGEKVKLHLTEIDQLQISGDRDRIKQVLLNLIGNAIQYTPQGGDIYVSLNQTAGKARIIIRDTGPGIPSEDLPYIFERFYRAEKSRTRSKSTGFGLGLSITHWIVEKHGGTIEVDSKQNQGTTFCIWLPLLSE